MSEAAGQHCQERAAPTQRPAVVVGVGPGVGPSVGQCSGSRRVSQVCWTRSHSGFQLRCPPQQSQTLPHLPQAGPAKPRGFSSGQEIRGFRSGGIEEGGASGHTLLPPGQSSLFAASELSSLGLCFLSKPSGNSIQHWSALGQYWEARPVSRRQFLDPQFLQGWRGEEGYLPLGLMP